MAGAMPIDAVASSFANLGDEVGAAGSELAKLADVVAKLTAPIMKSIESLGNLGGDLTKVGDGLTGGFSKRLATSTEAMGKVFGMMTQKVTGLVGSVGAGFASLSRAATGLAGTFGRVIGGLAKMNGALLSGVAAMVQNLTSLSGQILPAINQALSGLAGPLGGALIGTITTALNPLRSLGNFLAPFMDALNPALMEQLGFAFKDLYAVVGRALTPIMGALIPVVRTFADAMVPVSAALKPVFENLAKIMVQVAGTYIPLLAGSLISVAPVFERLAGTVLQVASQFGGVLFQAVDAVIPVFGAVGNGLGKFITALAPIFGKMSAAILQVVQGVAPFVTSLIPSLGTLAESFVNLQVSIGGALFDLGKALAPLVEMAIPALTSALTTLADVVAWAFEKMRGAGGWVDWAKGLAASARDEVVDTGMDVANSLLKVFGQGPMFDVQRNIGAVVGNQGQQQGQGLLNFVKPKIDVGASMGAATRSANFMGISELGSNLQAAAFGAGQTPEMKTAENTATLIQKMDQLIGQGVRQLAGQQAFKGNQLAPGIR